MLVRAVHRGAAPGRCWSPTCRSGRTRCRDEHAVATAIRFVKEGGADAVKLERGGTSAPAPPPSSPPASPSMGHVGLTPQTATALGGYRAQGRQGAQAAAIVVDAVALRGGPAASPIVAEAVPAPVAAHMPRPPRHPGHRHRRRPRRRRAGARAPRPRRLQRRLGAPVRPPVRAACIRRCATPSGAYVDDVRAGTFPTVEHTYPISDDELAAFQEAGAAKKAP